MSDGIFNFNEKDALGYVISVDTAQVIIDVNDIEKLRAFQVNKLVALQSSHSSEFLIGFVQKITRQTKPLIGEDETEKNDNDMDEIPPEINRVRVILIGTFFKKLGEENNVFRRTLETVPEINAACFSVTGIDLSGFMRAVTTGEKENSLILGKYTIDASANAFLNGDLFFQRHAMIVGSTGSGKSWTTANIIEQTAKLANGNALVFDIHGEYSNLQGNGFEHYKIASSTDIDAKRQLEDGIIHLPYWLLNYNDLVSMFVDRSDQNAPNQTMIMANAIRETKKSYIEGKNLLEIERYFTLDSPIPFCLSELLDKLRELNEEKVLGQQKTKNGDLGQQKTKNGEYNGKLGRLIARLESKKEDRRLAFMFGEDSTIHDLEWLKKLAARLFTGRQQKENTQGGIKIINFSEVPSDILPLSVSLIARMALNIQQWSDRNDRHPIALFCDEAHLYIAEDSGRSLLLQSALETFERISKEGRKYGVGLVIISQRPSEINRTVLSQCNNVIAMRLTNAEDQHVIRRLLPDSLGGFSDVLPILDVGEALVVGDASLLPSRIRINKPETEPKSGTIPFWQKWAQENTTTNVPNAVNNWLKQSIV
ncbi:MAG: ATP-binding protein [Alphaproteobacteria bacterium]